MRYGIGEVLVTITIGFVIYLALGVMLLHSISDEDDLPPRSTRWLFGGGVFVLCSCCAVIALLYRAILPIAEFWLMLLLSTSGAVLDVLLWRRSVSLEERQAEHLLLSEDGPKRRTVWKLAVTVWAVLNLVGVAILLVYRLVR
jgi:hypothetical protein